MAGQYYVLTFVCHGVPAQRKMISVVASREAIGRGGQGVRGAEVGVGGRGLVTDAMWASEQHDS